MCAVKWLFSGLALGLILTACKPNEPEAPTPAPRSAPSPSHDPSTEQASPPSARSDRFGLEPSVHSIKSVAPGEFEITYEWKLTRKRDEDFRVFVHFTDEDGRILFQNDHDPKPPTSQWAPGLIQQGPMRVKIPEGLEGTVMIRMGLYRPEAADIGKPARDPLDGREDGELRIIVGYLDIRDGRAAFRPTE